MRKNKIIAFALVVLMCTTVFAPSFAGAIDISWDYNISYNGGYIMGIPERVEPQKFEWSMKEKTEVSTTQEHIGTGSSVKIADKSYKAVVLGDVDGNGVVDTTDYLNVKKYCLGDVELNGAFLEAADVDGDRPVDATDYLRIKGHFLEMFNLYEGSYLKAPERFHIEGLPAVVEDAGFVDPLEVGYNKALNPIGEGMSDPTIAYHEGKYYWYFTSPFGHFISSFDSLDEITTDNAVPVNYPIYHNADSELWAPELHFIDGYWYVYYAVGVGANHRMHVLKSKKSSLLREDYLKADGTMEEAFEYVGVITDSSNKWAIDGSVFKYKGGMYFTWSGWAGDVDGQQNIYIAKMSSPTTISSERVEIAVPYYDWEKKKGTLTENPTVNEAPYAFSQGDYLTIVYSASGSWCDDYCLGQLLYLGGDVLDPSSWHKHTEPILKTIPDRFYAPGHSCVVPSENGVWWMMFHANKYSGKGWEGRDTFLEPIRINENGIIEVINSDVKFPSIQDVVQNAGFVDPNVTGYTPIGNPARQGSPDPQIAYHDGKYYWIGYCSGIGGFFAIELDVFNPEHLAELNDSTKNIFTYEKVKFVGLSVEGLDTSGDVWAPELHFIGEYWYIYFAYLAPGADVSARRMYVAKSKNKNDLSGGFEAPQKIYDWRNDKWAIDGSVFEYEGELYFTWSGWEGDVNVQQNIYIARMSDPMTLSSERVCISVPSYDWERQKGEMPENPYVNEGPVAITQGDYLTIVYSASGSWCDNYCLGQLLFLGGDILNPNRWQKIEYPILSSMNGFYGPGHNCFITDENGVIWVVFHAKPTGGTTGWDNRHTYMYPIRINENGIVEVVVS